MSNLSNLEFVALDISGKNYLSWVLDAEIHLAAKALSNTITQGNEASSQDTAKAMIFLRHHLDEGLKVEYLTVKDPLELWTGLKERYDHLKATVLPRAQYEWMYLQLQDFTTQQYRERGFKKYSELISCLLVAEQHNTLLLKNHEARPTGSAPLPKANMEARRDKLYQNSIKRKANNIGTSFANAPAESHLTFKNDFEAGPSNKNDDNAKANLALNDDDFEGLDDLTHLEVEYFFGDQN
ncbi:PREDICTED: uncharacterized protein LOC109229917 [Nicotiana attenuata]|uniref:uncharacterized protein LOC109229917 n=1 Tax=Nicotiana attenuata TaxID=49451 RepID=UPI000904AE81|nr:PREDICTED: uncharacterized protein LOC109229917 [Nicotiana attenuata]